MPESFTEARPGEQRLHVGLRDTVVEVLANPQRAVRWHVDPGGVRKCSD